MKEYYDLNELAMITSLTTRTLRNHLRQGTLNGEKIDGAWRFTPEDVDAFMSDPAVRRSIRANHNAVVYDFLADAHKPANRACAVFDYAVGLKESAEIMRFYCECANAAADIELRCDRVGGLTRIILSGAEDQIADIVNKYYGR